jgi:hypothetical protein
MLALGRSGFLVLEATSPEQLSAPGEERPPVYRHWRPV